LYDSGYRELVQRRFLHWIDKLSIPQTPAENAQALRELHYLIDDLLDFFFVQHTADLNVVVIPQVVLRYQQLPEDFVAHQQFCLDLLDFERESEQVYTSVLELTEDQVRNVTRHFLSPEPDERIWFICDQSLLGKLRKGFAMTNKALYWKSRFQGAQRVYYHKLRSLTKEKEWLLINDLYFNATPSLNTKLIWLLRKLARLHEAAPL
ncbi:MAG: hypothetical protein D6772_17660, partial [Bacteroidetes bacterium]